MPPPLGSHFARLLVVPRLRRLFHPARFEQLRVGCVAAAGSALSAGNRAAVVRADRGRHFGPSSNRSRPTVFSSTTAVGVILHERDRRGSRPFAQCRAPRPQLEPVIAALQLVLNRPGRRRRTERSTPEASRMRPCFPPRSVPGPPRPKVGRLGSSNVRRAASPVQDLSGEQTPHGAPDSRAREREGASVFFASSLPQSGRQSRIASFSQLLRARDCPPSVAEYHHPR